MSDAGEEGAILVAVDPQKAQYCADLVATIVVSQYSKEHGLSTADALRKIMRTKTYEVLQDPESRLCFESAESILDMLRDEEEGNWDAWLSV